MAYSIQALAQLAGVSPRTLRYYDQIGLLPASRNPDNGYREYSPAVVDRLQLIRYFQTFGFSLAEIQSLLTKSSIDQTAALTQQRAELAAQRDHLTNLLQTLDRTLAARKGGPQMTDSEKFAAFKRQQLTENDREFGAEARQLYGQETVAASEHRFGRLREADYQAMQEIEKRLFIALKKVAASGDLTSSTAKEVYQLHRQWLCFTWNNYTTAAHQGLAQMYVDDGRFASYYNDHVGLPNAAETLVAVIQRYAQ
ncbi:MerR family transcriptional regulator [Levilactobacillus fujinensis]|uniref:MerR family transcriptional regulator n=1 Tax=Levilactobacillus fujinensis TaxID=2486024 RepID=A0ABW1TH80_9LACO|nr:MerR family transcriptional regulator [Levilactobacillus fujinensis]